MALPHPRQAANILTQGIQGINSLNRQVMNAFTNAQISMIRSLAEAAPNLPSFTTGARRGNVSVQFPRIEKVFSAVPDALAKSMPSTGATKGIAQEKAVRYRGRTAMF